MYINGCYVCLVKYKSGNIELYDGGSRPRLGGIVPFWYMFYHYDDHLKYLDALMEIYASMRIHFKETYGYKTKWTNPIEGTEGDYRAFLWGDLYPLTCYGWWYYDLAKHLKKIEDISVISSSEILSYTSSATSVSLTTNITAGDLALITVYPAGRGMPTSVSIGGTTYSSPVPTREDFDVADYDCWYYDSANNLIYIKAKGHSPVEITISWAAGGGIPPPPPEEERPAPQPQLPAMRPELLLLVMLAAAALVAFLASRRR